ncbi:MAG: hypothetical protein HY825_06790 [Acidobacteria bacterium]|nr:hypothetical protein [Acidobacteriota bacterium]
MASSRAARLTKGEGPSPGSTFLWSAALFFVIAGVYMASHVRQSGGDTVWFIPIAQSLLREGDTEIGEYREILATHPGYAYAVETREGSLYSRFPVGTALVVVPAVAVAQVVEGTERLFGRIRTRGDPALEKMLASFIVAAAAVVVFHLSLGALPPGLAAANALGMAFCTAAWSTASRALWQHGPSMLALALTLLLLLRGEHRRWARFAAGACVAFAIVIRPTNAISAVVLLVYVGLFARRRLAGYVAGLAAVLLPLAVYHHSIYGSLLSPYFSPTRVADNSRFLEALAGNLVSPARGLLVYSPVVALSIAGLVIAIRRRRPGSLEPSLGLIVCLHWVAISGFAHWWGGWCYGPRFFADLLPFLAFLAIPALRAVQGVGAPRRPALLAAVGVAILWSLLVNYRGANARATAAWSWSPVSVDERPERVWDWGDPPFLRGLTGERPRRQ